MRVYPKPGLSGSNKRKRCPRRLSRPLDAPPPSPCSDACTTTSRQLRLSATTINARIAPSYVGRRYFANTSRNSQLTCTQTQFPCSDISALSSFFVSFPLSSPFLHQRFRLQEPLVRSLLHSSCQRRCHGCLYVIAECGDRSLGGRQATASSG